MIIFKNSEFKKVFIIFIIITAFIVIAFCSTFYFWSESIKNGVHNQNAAAVGSIISIHPELSDVIVPSIINSKSEDIEAGNKAFEKYGYTKNVALNNAPVIKELYNTVLLFGCGIILLCSFSLFLFMYLSYKRFYSDVGEISKAAQKVVDGDFSEEFDCEGEGEMDILRHNFNQMANRLRLSVERLQREKVFLKDTIADISHQLKTPLSTLTINNDLLLENSEMDTGTRRSFYEADSRQITRLQWLIQSLLKMARLEAGAIAFKKEDVSLKDVAENCIESLSAFADEKSVKITADDVDAHFTGDREWTSEAALNIVKNAVEHSKNTIVRIEPFKTQLSSGVIISDNGEGIDKKDLPHIFERFYKSSNTVKANSIGIGLSLAKAIIEGQGGSISVKSERGKGTTFTITFLKTVI